MMAVKGGQTATVNTLLKGNADVNVQEKVSSACELCGLCALGASAVNVHVPLNMYKFNFAYGTNN